MNEIYNKLDSPGNASSGAYSDEFKYKLFFSSLSESDSKLLTLTGLRFYDRSVLFCVQSNDSENVFMIKWLILLKWPKRECPKLTK